MQIRAKIFFSWSTYAKKFLRWKIFFSQMMCLWSFVQSAKMEFPQNVFFMQLYHFFFFVGRSSASLTTYEDKSKTLRNYDPKVHFEPILGKFCWLVEAGGFSEGLAPKFRKKIITFFWCDKNFPDQNVFYRAQWDKQVGKISTISISDPKILNETRHCIIVMGYRERCYCRKSEKSSFYSISQI